MLNIWTHINIHRSKCFPTSTHTHTPCFSELVCYIAERSSKQSPQRHSALLPASNSKSCPWSGEVGGQLWFGEAGQARSCIRLLVWNKKKKERKSVLHTEENIVVPVPHLPVCAVSRALFSHKALCSFVGLNEICALQIKSGNSHLTGTQKRERLSASFTASKSWQCAVIFCQCVNNHCIKNASAGKLPKTSQHLLYPSTHTHAEWPLLWHFLCAALMFTILSYRHLASTGEVPNGRFDTGRTFKRFLSLGALDSLITLRTVVCKSNSWGTLSCLQYSMLVVNMFITMKAFR